MGEPDLDALLRDLDDAEQQDLACCIQLCRDAAAAIRRLTAECDSLEESHRLLGWFRHNATYYGIPWTPRDETIYQTGEVALGKPYAP